MPHSLPVPMLSGGYTFMPSDEELVVQYLRPRAMNQRVPCAIIVDVKIMRYNPWDLLPEGSQDKYFFTQKEFKHKVGTRRNRMTSEGYWRATGTEIPIHSRFNGKLVGIKRSLVFYQGYPPNGEPTKWAMQEFCLAGAGLWPFPMMRPVTTDNKGPHLRCIPTTIENKKDDALVVALVPADSHDSFHPVMISPDESWVICRVYQKRSHARCAIVQEVNAWGNGAQYIDFMGEANRELSPPASSTSDTVSLTRKDTGTDNKKAGDGNDDNFVAMISVMINKRLSDDQ